MKIYVASSFNNKEVVRGLQNYLIERGHTITCDWTPETWTMEKPSGLGETEAMGNIFGVRECDIFIGLYDNSSYTYKGSIFELGMAYAYGKIIILVGHELDNMVFINLESILKLDDRESLRRFIEDGSLGL